MRAGKGSGSDARSLRAATADGLGASSGREDGVVRSPGAAPPSVLPRILPAERLRGQSALGFRGARAPQVLSWTPCSRRHSSGCRGSCTLWGLELHKSISR